MGCRGLPPPPCRFTFRSSLFKSVLRFGRFYLTLEGLHPQEGSHVIDLKEVWVFIVLFSRWFYFYFLLLHSFFLTWAVFQLEYDPPTAHHIQACWISQRWKFLDFYYFFSRCFPDWDDICTNLDLNSHLPKPPPEEKDKAKEGEKKAEKEAENGKEKVSFRNFSFFPHWNVVYIINPFRNNLVRGRGYWI